MIFHYRKQFFFLILFIGFAFSLPLYAANPVNIMPLGDSITRGWYGSAYHWGYREPLYLSLANHSYSFDFVGGKSDGSFSDPNHEGHDGWRADELLNGRITDPCAGKLENWLTASQPDLILLHIGTNDITQGNQDANEVNSILNVIDSYEVLTGKNVPVVLALIIDRVPNSPATTAYNNDLNTMASNRIANMDNLTVVNMQYALNYSTDMADSLHPNDSGYAKMANVWYNALTGILLTQRTLTCSSSDGGFVSQPGEGQFVYDDNSVINLTAVSDTGYHFVNWTGTAVNAGRVADPNSSSTEIIIDGDYNVIAQFAPGLENSFIEINSRLELRTSGIFSDFTDYFIANGWYFNTTEDLSLKINFHYSHLSQNIGSVGINVGDDVNYVQISAGSDANELYFYYSASIDGNVFSEQQLRTSNDGTIYISYDSAAKEFYLSTAGFGVENAYIWQTPNALKGLWSTPIYVSLCGRSSGIAIGSGQAYLENFEISSGSLTNWPPATDLDNNGYIEIYDLANLCEQWLNTGPADFDNSGIVDFLDLDIFGIAW